MNSTKAEVRMPKKKYAYVDAHADTIVAAMDAEANLYENDLHVDFKRLMMYDMPTVQVLPIYVDENHLNRAYEYTNEAIDFLENQLQTYSNVAALALSAADIEKNAKQNKLSIILALEGGEPLEGNIENLFNLHKRGVRLITLTWSRENELGYGVLIGSNEGLKPFGIDAVRKMNELGIMIDVSHLNEQGFWDVQKISKRAVMASHSNAHAICAHERNLKDDQIKALHSTGGVVGLNLVPSFLNSGGNADMSCIIKHFRHFEKLSALGIYGMGCDFDGTSRLPENISCVSSVNTIAAHMEDEFGQDITESIMSAAMLDYFKREFV